ncbi:MAG TPA: hypothetical protein VFX37_04475, partial [Pseudolabrys sp.]|nr:hypothetical protein [Pseudolabrys sp.]
VAAAKEGPLPPPPVPGKPPARPAKAAQWQASTHHDASAHAAATASPQSRAQAQPGGNVQRVAFAKPVRKDAGTDPKVATSAADRSSGSLGPLY